MVDWKVGWLDCWLAEKMVDTKVFYSAVWLVEMMDE